MSSERLCPFCGEPELLDVLDVFDGRDFMLETCCEDLHEAWIEDLNDPHVGDVARQELAELVGDYVPTRQIYNDEERGQIRIDAGLEVRPIRRNDAKDFIREHHRHNPPPAGDRFRFGAFNGGELVAVMMAGRPVARMLDADAIVEVNRLCVDHSKHRALTWKACSELYGAAVDEARERGFEKVISYTLESESGMSLRYARFKPEATTKGGSWDRPSRRRKDRAPTCPKVRWARAC